MAQQQAIQKISEHLRTVIRIQEDFPKPGISFKDITPIFLKPALVRACVAELVEPYRQAGITKVAGIDSRGFLLGPMIAQELNAGFLLVRKQGKLPRHTLQQAYELEYGSATIEAHREDITPEDVILIHDDLLATGGTANAAALLIRQTGAQVAGFSFIVGLPFLNGSKLLHQHAAQIHTLVEYTS
jgi:adenine phosphoribosyltransferase